MTRPGAFSKQRHGTRGASDAAGPHLRHLPDLAMMLDQLIVMSPGSTRRDGEISEPKIGEPFWCVSVPRIPFKDVGTKAILQRL